MNKKIHGICQRAGALLLLCMLVGILLSTTAIAQNRGAYMILQGAQGDALMETLGNAVWVPDGKASDKQIYVVFSTDCGFCKQLFRDSRPLTSTVQFRWITHCCIGKGGEYVAQQHTPDAIASAFANQAAAVKDLERAIRELDLNRWAANALPHANNLLYPTVVYRTAKGVMVNFGIPADLNQMIASVASQPEKGNYHSTGLDLLDKPIVLASAGKMKDYFNSTSKPMALYASPDPAAPKVANIPVNYGYRVMGVANKEWIKVPGLIIAGVEVPGYIHAPLDIKLSQLVYTVRPVSAAYNTTKTIEIRLHPDMDSPVVDKIDAGYVLTKTGEVSLGGRQWTEVILYTDGTKGYLLP